MPRPQVFDLDSDPAELVPEPVASLPGAQALMQGLDGWWQALKSEAREESTLDLGASDQQLLEQLGYGGE